jgi:hypothetical protein
MLEKEEITTKWFYGNVHPILKVLSIFVKGDALVIVPLFGAIFLLGLVDPFAMVLFIGVYYAVRNCGEIMYWLLQQFGPKIHRPYDFGFTKLSNNAIYIIYQLLSIVQAAAWITFVLYILY